MKRRRHPRGLQKDYVVIGGMVTSRKTGDRVYAEARKLALAYGIDPKRAVCFDTLGKSAKAVGVQRWLVSVCWDFLPVLEPRDAGDYAAHRKAIDREWGYA